MYMFLNKFLHLQLQMIFNFLW